MLEVRQIDEENEIKTQFQSKLIYIDCNKIVSYLSQNLSKMYRLYIIAMCNYNIVIPTKYQLT